MSAAVPAVVQKNETSKPGNAEVKPGMFSFGAKSVAATKPSGFTFGQQASAPTASFSFGASSRPTPPQTTSQQPAQVKPDGVAGFTVHPPPATDKPKPTSGFAFGAAPTPASAAPFAFGGNAPASPQPTAPGANLFSQTATAPRKKNPLRKRSIKK